METLDLHKKDDGFKPTQEELETIRKKMDDPEFMKLWMEYAKDISDPKHRAEEEEYLRQMEREAREGGDYSFEFIFPKPVFCVQLLQDARGQKTYINFCECEKVDPFTESRTGDSGDANWHVPVVCGKPRKDEFEGRKVDVYDCIFHPKTVGLANQSDRFMCFLVEIAVENINAGYQQTFGFEFRRLTSPTVIGEPQNQTLRKQGAQPLFPKSNEPVSKRPVAPAAAPAAVAAKPASKAAPAPALPRSTLDYKISHRGEIDLSDAWNWKQSDRRIGVPKELVVSIKLPLVTSVSQIEVDILGHSIAFKCAKMNCDEPILLPFSVEEVPKTAKFDKSKQELTLVLTVVPPPAPPAPTEVTVAEQPEKEDARDPDAEARAELEAAKKWEAEQKQQAQPTSPPKVAPAAPSPAVPAPVAPAPAVADASAEVAAVMEKVAAARRAREQEEAAEREKAAQEKAAKEAETAAREAAAAAERQAAERRREEQEERHAAEQLEKKRLQEEEERRQRAAEAEAQAQAAAREAEAAAAAPKDKEKEGGKAEVEVVDLRTKTAPPPATTAQSSGVVMDDEDDVITAEQRAAQVEAQKRIRAEKEAERAAAALAQKMAELPLCSRHIFAID